MKKTILLLVLLSTAFSISAIDYQYQYFSEDKEESGYMPFSDYIPKTRKYVYTTPLHVEDYYQLYGMEMYYQENDLRFNIEKLKTALNCKFRHPAKALCKIETEKEYYKYRNLMFMHINILIMRNYMKIAAKYDKRDVYFYDSGHWADHIKKSFDIAESLYKQAQPYWIEARKYAKTASKVKITLDLGTMETERYEIMTGELDYGDIINDHLKRLNKKRKKLDKFIQQNQ